MTKQQAGLWVRLAAALGAVSGCLSLASNLALGSASVLDLSSIEALLLWLMAFGIYRRSRVAAVLMIAYYVATRLIIVGLGPDYWSASPPFMVMSSLLVLLVYVQGARGVFALSGSLPVGEPRAVRSRDEPEEPVGRGPSPTSIAPDRHQPTDSPDVATLNVDDILAIGWRRRVRSAAMVIGFSALVIYGVGSNAALGMPVIVIGSLLFYQSVRGDVIVLWLRRFHEPRSRAVNVGRLLVRACGLLAIPMTVQDSTFKFDRVAAMMRSFFVPVVCMSLIGNAMLMMAQGTGRDLLRQYAWPAISLIGLVAFAIGALWYRRAGYFAVTTEEAESYVRRLIGKIEGRTGWFAPGVVTVRCADSCWRQAVEVCMERAAVAVIDVTRLTENIVWEVQTALRLLPPVCVVLIYAVEREDDEATAASVVREVGTHLGTELPTGVMMLGYPAAATSGLGAWGAARSIADRFTRLIASALLESPRAATLRAAR